MSIDLIIESNVYFSSKSGRWENDLVGPFQQSLYIFDMNDDNLKGKVVISLSL
jgi:hypothetical protein